MPRSLPTLDATQGLLDPRFDEAWRAYLAKVNPHHFLEYQDLLDNPRVRPEFQARALAHLLVETENIPERFRATSHMVPWGTTERVLSAQTPPLLEFGISLMLDLVDSDKVNSNGYGYLDKDTARACLKLLPADHPLAKRCSDHYPLKRFAPLTEEEEEGLSEEEQFSFRPFWDLLTDPTIPERWKREADARMRLLIEQELQLGGQESETSIVGEYRYILADLRRTKPFPYSIDFYAEQWRYCFERVDVDLRIIQIGIWPFDAIFFFAEYPELDFVLHAFARHLASIKEQVLEEQDASAFNLLIKRYPNDQEMVAGLTRALDAGRAHREKKRAEEQTKREALELLY